MLEISYIRFGRHWLATRIISILADYTRLKEGTETVEICEYRDVVDVQRCISWWIYIMRNEILYKYFGGYCIAAT